MILKKKALSIVMAAMMAFSVTAVGVFADGETTSNTISLIGAAPFAGATNVAPGGGSDMPIQPVRIALSSGAADVVANINDADASNDYIKIMNGESQVSVSASQDGCIVVLTPEASFATGTLFNVNFSGILSEIDDYTFTTSQGGTGNGGTGTGGGGGQQALTLTGQIPADGNKTVGSGQTLYAVFSNSLLPGTNNKTEYGDSLGTHNEGQVSVTTSTGAAVTGGWDVEIIDNWTIKVSTKVGTGEDEISLSPGTYKLVIGTLTANNNKTYSGKEITFTVSATAA